MNRSEQIDKALKDILKDVDCAKANKQCDIDYFLSSIEKCAKAALAIPRRQCDVGTPQEQIARHQNYCGNGSGNIRCINSPNSECKECFAKWMQMPCPEGVGKCI